MMRRGRKRRKEGRKSEYFSPLSANFHLMLYIVGEEVTCQQKGRNRMRMMGSYFTAVAHL